MKIIKKYGFKECCESLDEGINVYKDDEVADKLPRILENRKKYAGNENLGEMFYIRAIVRNRFNLNKNGLMIATDLLHTSIMDGYSIESLKKVAETASSFNQWIKTMEE